MIAARQKTAWDQSALMLCEPLVVAIAERTARLVREELRQLLLELKQPQKIQPRWIDYEAAATRLNLTVTALRQRKAAGKIPDWVCSQMGKTVRFDVEALDRWMESLMADCKPLILKDLEPPSGVEPETS